MNVLVHLFGGQYWGCREVWGGKQHAINVALRQPSALVRPENDTVDFPFLDFSSLPKTCTKSRFPLICLTWALLFFALEFRFLCGSRNGVSTVSLSASLPAKTMKLLLVCFFNKLSMFPQYHVQLNNQQWANQQMMYYPSMYQMPSQDHMQPHPAVSMGQQLSPAVPQMIYQAQQMQVNKLACLFAPV